MDFNAYLAFVLVQLGANTEEVSRIEIGLEALALGPENVALVLSGYLQGEDARVAHDWVCRHWVTMTKHAVKAFNSSAAGVFARLGTPVANFSHIPPDVLAHYTITDWLRGLPRASTANLSSPYMPGSTAARWVKGRALRRRMTLSRRSAGRVASGPGEFTTLRWTFSHRPIRTVRRPACR